jgi:uncharacterized membrane protein HdeD (DUF308 family)
MLYEISQGCRRHSIRVINASLGTGELPHGFLMLPRGGNVDATAHSNRLMIGAQTKPRVIAVSTVKPEFERVQTALTTSLLTHWKLFLIEGIVLVVLGLAAVMLPLIATIAVAIIVGWIFLLSGVVGLVATFRMRQAPGFWWSLFSGILGVAAGVVLLRWPLSGALSLTFVLTLFLLLEGVLSIMFALEHKRQLSGRWGMMLLSGVVDLILAGIIFAGLPGTAAWAIGLLVGVNMVFGGSALIAMALHARDAAPRVV